MSKRPLESDDLLEQLKLACKDPLQVQGLLESQSIATIADVVTTLLAAVNLDAPIHAKHQRKAHNRPRMVNELFVEVVFFMDRDSLDSMQLACRFMLHYIREREANELALRRIWNVHLGKMWRVGRPNPDDEGYWLPRAEIDFKCVHGLLPYLRLAYCGSVYVLLETIQSIQSYEIACGMLFDDLNVRETHVESLDVYSHQGSVDLLNRSINAFKSVRQLNMTPISDELIEPEAFDEAFFASLAHRGIEYFRSELFSNQERFLEIDAETALAYAFAEPTDGPSRELTGLQISIENDFLELVRKKAGELDGRQRVDLEATIGLFLHDIDPTGFEKYETGEGKWVVDDLHNGLKLEIEACTNDSSVFIRVNSQD